MIKLRFLLIGSLSVSLTAGMMQPVLAEPAPNDQVRILDERPAQSSKHDEPHTVIEGEKGITLVTNNHTETIGEGAKLTTFERFDARGWLNGEMMKVDLANGSVYSDILHPGVVSKAEPLSETANREGAIAGVNGDFFDINGTKAPVGAEIQDGNLLKGAATGRDKSAGVDTDGIGQIADILLEGTMTFNENSYKLTSFNQYGIPANGIGLYSNFWGTASRSGVAGSSKSVHEVRIQNGKVVESRPGISNEDISEDTFVLIGRETGATILQQLSVGQEISIQYAPKVSNGNPFKFAIGGNPVLVKDGEVQDVDNSVVAPRTAVGYSADGKQMYLVTVDGRQTGSRGLTLYELGELMKEFGAHQALNLDGGGSTTMVARTPGEDQVDTVNSPSDGFERAVPNGIGLFTEKGTGELFGMNVSTESEIENSDRVFPGLTRKFSARGFDNVYDPVQTGQVSWQALPADVGKLDDEGVFHAAKSGKANVEAQNQDKKGTNPVTVLDDLERIEANLPRLGLADGATGQFYMKGYDRNGYSAPIEPQDVNLEYDQSIIDIKKNTDGSFSVIPKVSEGSVLVTATVQGQKAFLPVTVGLKTENVSEMETLPEWRFSTARGSGSIESTEGMNGNGIKVNFDFSKSTGTRTANVHPVNPLFLPGEPQSIGIWVKGNGKGEWMSFTTKGSDGSNHYLYGPYVTWTGWKKIEIPVPSGVKYPLELRTIGAIETDKSKQYTDELVYDDLTVKVSPTVEVPVVQEKPDPIVLQNAEIGGDRWKFAVMADSQFIAGSLNSQQVRLARESLRQIVKANPDFLIIGGDFVDTAYKEDFALAEQILEEEVGDKIPVYYIPGNHEIMGTGNLNNFLDEFKENNYFFTHKGTQFALMDSSTGSLRTSDFSQLVEFKNMLEKAASDPAIKNLVVLEHHPTRDPLSTQNSQLTDRKEAELLEKWLTEFREESKGKGVLHVSGHAHTVNVERVDGVPYMVVGPTGKAPYGPPNAGGFHEWTMFGVDPTPVPSNANGPERSSEQSPVRDTEWVRAEVNPLLEDVTMDAPETVSAGETVKVDATGHQAGNVNFPLRYPASVNWSGSNNLFMGTGEALDKAKESNQYIAVFDTATLELTGLQQGEILLKVESNGTTAEKIISIQ
ncbi:phosphodiester glycosidase family protein [Fictibacillus terranigra]|uniref:Phosphodiester glycosidase family protein n=1 Tax=Fictibacillus terranigra TaxID=3058424 RepID=A0ABT8ECG2_9BACL|nr:phosphodiester glycosidase family protein [Fictibacillus sp. CENA-BCM004]MDN4075517.1 phosphodiester glycosidase family protein [Fictibacillus sp. CENA-BCM004]